MENENLTQSIDFIINEIGKKSPVIVKRMIMGKVNPIEAAVIYVNELADKDIIDRDVLNPLMLQVNEELYIKEGLSDYICKKFIPMSNTWVEANITNVVEEIKNGKAAILIDQVSDFILADTTGGVHRLIADPANESAIVGSREGFVENIETNISILRRRIKDKNLVVENVKLGKRSQTQAAILYIDDIANKDIVTEFRRRINAVDVDVVNATQSMMQYIEDYPFTIFPQYYATERADVVESNLMEGRIALLINGTPGVATVPAIFIEFFQGVEDYLQRTVISSFARLIRLLAVFIVTTLPSIYITLIKYNVELIPISFIIPIASSRTGISLTPFMEVLGMSIIVELLREGGLRLPVKIASTLSLVGGIIIGEMVVKSKIVSPTTLLIVGITVVSSFAIPHYNMALVIRLISFPMLVLANLMGIFGIAAGWFFLLVHITALDSFGVPYFSLTKSSLKDFVIRAPLWQMNTRPEDIAVDDKKRQTDFRKTFKKNN